MKKTEIIDIKANIKTTLAGMDKVISDMEAGLKNQKFDVSKNTNLSKLIKQYKDAKEELDSLTSSGFIRQEDVKKVVNLGDKISKTYRQIGNSFRQIQEGEDSVLKTLFPANFSTQIAKATKEINNFFSNLENKEIKNKELTKLTADLKLLDAELDKVENKRIKVEIDADKEKTKKTLEEIEKQTNQLQNKIQIRLTPEEPKNAKGLSKEAELEAKVKSTQESYSKAVEKSEKLTQRALRAKERAKIDKLQQQLIDQDGISTIAVKENAIKEIQEELGKRATRKASGKRGQGGVNFRGESDQDLRDRITVLKTELIALKDVAKQVEDIERKPQEDYEANKKVAEANVKRASTNLEKAKEKLGLYKEQREAEIKLAESKAESFIKGEAVAEATDAEREELKKLNAEKERQLELQKQYNKESSFQSQEDKDLAIETKKSEIAGKKISIDKINKSLKDLNQATDIEELFKKLEALNVPLTDIEHSTNGLKQLKENLDNLDSKTAETIRKELEKLGFSADQTKEFIEDLSEELAQIKLDETNFIRARQEIEDLKNQVKYFFSLTNTIDLFKRTVNSALQTVRELDKVMTETATVTEFSIGDMWDKLPVYSRNASQLGASIKDLYSATTLYYQQGLKTNEAMSVGIETMKMARIANMDAKDATTAMTAALRGFNMEINEVSAQRINDVYSELAAITAADTSQIAAAMTKTASIASSANMEFETTAALLAQIIETTQEAPETAGTAMKTIIARFTEVKELFSEGILTGADEEGESIDINKIDTALKTVGISLKDFLNGTKGIDDIFLELASKWDSLDLATQRYIATTAAGSRQQSRFIAMMSNYERTMELVNAANTSAGASAEQFNKTLESMEAKLQRLKNAWDEFAMGLANNELLKFGVDLLTGFLNTVNAITSGISGENGLIKSVVNLATVLGLLKGGSTLIGSFFKEKTISGSVTTSDGKESQISFSLGGLAGQKEGEQTGKAFVKGVKTAIENAEKGKKLKAGIVSLFGDLEYEDVKIGERTTKSKLNDKAQLALSERRGYLDRQVEGGHILEKEAQEDSVLKQIKDFGEELKDLNEEGLTEEVLKKAEELDISLEEINESIVVKKVKSYSLNLNAMGVAALGAARGIDLLSNYMKEIGKNDFAEKLDTISQTLSIVGSGALVASQTFQALGVSVKASSAGLAIGAKVFSYAQVGLFAAGIMGVVLAFTALQNAWKEWSPEGQLKKANKYLEQTSTMASEAAQRYNEVATGLEDLEKRTGSLKELSKGTREWREQVYELNSEVLNLIEKYPELRSFLDNDGELLVLRETDANGQTLDSVLENLEKTKYNTQAAKIEAGINVQERQNDIYYSQLGDSAKRKINLENANNSWRTISEEEKSRILAQGSIVSMNTTEGAWAIEMAKSVQESTEELARKIASGDLEAREIAEQEGLDISALTDFGRKLLESDKAIEAFTQSLISAAQANADVPEKYEDALDGAFTTDYATKLKEGYEQDILTAKDDELINYQKQYADNMGYEYIKGKFYSGQGADRKEVVIPHELLAKELAAQMASGQITEQTEKLVGALPKFKGTIFERIVAESEGGNLTREDLGALDGLFDEDGNPIMNEQGTKSKVAELYDDWGLSEEIIPLQQFYEMILSASNASQRAADTDSKLSEMGLTEEGIDFNKLSIGSAESIVNNLFDVFAVSGEKATKDLAVRLNNIIEHEDLSPEQAEIFAQTLGEIDWTDTNSIESFSVLLEEAGFTAWDLVGDIEGLEDEMAIAAHAVAKFNMDNITEQIKSFENLTKDISEREDFERTFTAEEKADMIKYNPDLANQFVKTGEDEWTYIGESMDGLVIALQENTRAMIEANGGEATHYYSQMNANDIIKQDSVFGDLTVTEDLEARDQALSGMIATQKGLQSQYEATIKAMGGFNKVSKKEQMLVKASIISANEYSKKLTKVAEVLNDNSDALDKSNEGTEVYQRAIDEVTKVAQEAFGDNVTTEFVEENIELFKLWGQGAEGATEKIREKLLENLLTMSEYEGSAEAVKTAIDQLKDSDFDIYGQMDASQIFNTLAQILGDANLAAQAIEGLGYSVTWEKVDEVPLELPSGKNMPHMVAQGDYSLPVYQVQVTNSLGTQLKQNKLNYGSSGGGGGSEYKNSQEKLYNQYEQINSLLRARNQIERQYNRLLDERSVTGRELLDNNNQQLANLQEQARIQQVILNGKAAQIQDTIAENSEYSKYVTGFDTQTGAITIDWEAFEALNGSDGETGEKVEAFLSSLEGLRDQWQEAQDSLDEIEDQVQEILLQGKDEYFDLEEQIKEAIVAERQEEIDKLTAINDTINDSNSRLIESMQNTISKERQARQNEEMEKELGDKRRRLAYLQQDTSGANALEIMQLQEEIKQDEQDYTDNLIDQKIALLQEQNDEAAKQRERQIEIMKLQLDQDISSGAIWEEVSRLWETGITDVGTLVEGSRLQQILESAAEITGLSSLSQEEWRQNLARNIAEAFGYVNGKRRASNGQEVTFTTADDQILTGIADEQGNITVGDKTYTDVYQNHRGEWLTSENYTESTTTENDQETAVEIKEPPELTENDKIGISAAIWNGGQGWGTGDTRAARLKEIFGDNDIQKNYVDKQKVEGFTGEVSDYSYEKMKSKYTAFKTGGLVDFTGPAWLDGTKTKPEYILNARQTEGFFRLIDILGSLNLNDNGVQTENHGDNFIDIDINIETVKEEADVDMLAEKLRGAIIEGATYRNNISIRR